MAWLSDLTADQAEQVLSAHDVPCSKVMTAEDIAADPHYAAREMLLEWEDDAGGTVRGTGLAPKFSGTPSRVWRGAPARDKDTDDVLAWLGYDVERIRDLRRDGTVGLRSAIPLDPTAAGPLRTARPVP